MDKRSRVRNAIANKPVDHVPVGFWFHFAGNETHGEANVRAHLKYYRQTDLDFLKVMSDGLNDYPLGLDEVRSPSDWNKVRPLPPDHPWIEEQVKRVAAIVREIGEERYVFYNVFAPFSFLRFWARDHAYGEEKLIRDVRDHSNDVLAALDSIACSLALLSRRVIQEAGADGIYFCAQSGEKGRFTPEEYHSWISPSDLYVLEHANRYSDSNILHLCGWAGQRNQLEIWQKYPAAVVNWAVHVDDLSLNDGRFFFDGRPSLGGFETHWDEQGRHGIIYTGSQDELQQYTRDLILDHGKRGLLLGGDCTIDAATDWERIRWIVQVARSL